MEDIISFKGKYAFLSNFFYVDVWYERVKYPTSENAYQAAKTTNHNERAAIQNVSPGKAKTLGQQVTERKDWKKLRIPTMTEILLVKFSNKKMKKMLLETRPALLIEGNKWHDNFWGDCSCEKCKNIVGQNNLGKIHWNIREGIYI